MKLLVRLQGETTEWIDDSCESDQSREAFLKWIRNQLYDRCVRDVYVEIRYQGPLLLSQSGSPSTH